MSMTTPSPSVSSSNPMRAVHVEKVTVNIGIGSPGERLEFAKALLERLTRRKPVETQAKRREPVFKLRPGLPIGTKVTLRGKLASEFLEKALSARKRTLPEHSFDNYGNLSFGVPEYIDFPGAKYDPKIGMMGFDVCVTLSRAGRRVGLRRIASASVGKYHHRISGAEARQFMQDKFSVKWSTEE